MTTADTQEDCLDAKLLLQVLTAVKNGDFSARLPVEWTGVNGKIADTFNEIMMLNQRMAAELSQVSQAVVQQGKITQRASLGPVAGVWAEQVQNINMLIKDLTWPVSETARVIGAALTNYQAGQVVSGASTITMQLARNLFLGPDERYEQSMDRKMLEAGLAQELTDLFSKDENLEM